MPVKIRLIAICAAGICLAGQVQAADLLTLFTTPQERQIINSNRYKSDEVKAVKPVEAEQAMVEESAIQQLILEEVSQEYLISGITISRDGAHTVWINSKIYEDGQQLDDKSRIKVVDGAEVRIRITAPDGKHYYGKSGETLEVTYMAPVED